MSDTALERIAIALESIAKDVKRFVEAADRNEAEAISGAPTAEVFTVRPSDLRRIFSEGPEDR